MNDFKEKWRLISSGIDRNDLIHRLCTNVEVENTANNKMVTKLHSSKTNMLFVVCKVHLKNNSKQGSITMSSLNMLVSFMTNGGQIMGIDKELLVDGKEIERLIITAKSK